MALIPVTNDGDSTRYVGGYAIHPGETREVPEHLVPADVDVVMDQDAVIDPVAQTLGHPIKGIVEMLPAMDDAELALVESAEIIGANRKGLLTAIAEEKLKRAANPKDGNEA